MKAVLVIDMPNNCEECKIIYLQGHGESSTCESGDWSKRPSWCPLRPLPEKKNEVDIYGFDLVKNRYATGWNDCLNAIIEEFK